MKEYKLIHRHLLGDNIKGIAFNRDDSLVAVIGTEIYIGTIDGKALYKGKPREDYEKYYWNLTKNVAPVSFYQVKWSQDNKFLWCAAGDFYEFSVENQQFRRIFETDQNLKCIDICDSKQLIALAGEEFSKENKIYLFKYNGSLINTINSKHGRLVYSLCFTSDGTKLISGGYDSYLRVWNVETGELLDEYKLDDSPTNLYRVVKDDQFIVKLRYDTSLYSLDANGKINLIKNLAKELFVKSSKGLLGYSIKDDVVLSSAYFYETAHCHTLDGEALAKIDSAGQIDFIEPGNTRDILALVFKYRRPPEVHFYSIEPKASFFKEDKILDWEAYVTYQDIRDLYFIGSIQSSPGNWIGIGTNTVGFFDSELKPIFKKKTDAQVYTADFNKKIQKLVYYKLNDQIHLIDLNKLDIQAIDEHRLSTYMTNVEKIWDVRLNHKGDRVATITDNKELIIFDHELMELSKINFKERVFHLAWNKNDNIIAVGADNGILYYYNVETGNVEELETIGIDRVEGITCDTEMDEFIVTGRRFINIFNQDGFVVRKFDFKTDTRFTLPTCRPESAQFALYGYDREGYKIYIVDRNKPIPECVEQIINYHTDLIRFLHWEDKDTLISEGNKIGFVFWKKM
ncbi:MAG: hypothetical protein ACFFD2_05935 [Promethearchaeota archaeon]